MIRFACPGCAATFTVDDNRSGKSGKCPKCQSEFVIPDMEPLQSTPTPASVSIPAPAPRNVDEPVEIEPCPKCSTKLSVSGSDIGNDVECPYCKTVFQAIKPGSRPQAPPPAPGRKSQFESTDDTGRPKSRRKDFDDDDDRPRKRRRDVDDDEEDIPKIKSKSESRRRDEEDDYDSPKSKNKSRRRDEDDEDEPKSKSRRRDEDDDDYDDRPRKKRYRSGGNGRRVIITRVNVLASGKVMAMMLAVPTFIVVLFVLLASLAVDAQPGRGGIGNIVEGYGIIALIGGPILYGIGGFIYGVILALIYNAASGIAGGFEMEIEED